MLKQLQPNFQYDFEIVSVNSKHLNAFIQRYFILDVHCQWLAMLHGWMNGLLLCSNLLHCASIGGPVCLNDLNLYMGKLILGNVWTEASIIWNILWSLWKIGCWYFLSVIYYVKFCTRYKSQKSILLTVDWLNTRKF